MTSLRIGIAGAGPAGLTFASILSRESKAKGRKIEFEIFERGDPKRDQGSGWDLNKTAQDALTRAGLHVPDVQRKGSDTVRFYKCNESNGAPLVCLRMPSLLTRLGIKKDHILEMMNPETERNKIIDGLLKALGPDVKVRYNCQITGARHNDDKSKGDKIELLGAEDKSLGSFDLLVDASGVSAPLRHNRFSAKADAFYTGTTIVQGVVYSPEESWPAQVVKQLGEGTLALVGPSKDGKGYVDAYAQRYGAKQEDKVSEVCKIKIRPCVCVCSFLLKLVLFFLSFLSR
jgi:2-polyprenyl-6-methoxyphenol hydroxylase-like FAD-dependent oxidoreductase